MTRKLNNDNGLQDWKTEHQAVTGGIFYCRDSADFSVSASNKLSCNLTGQCFEIGNKNIVCREAEHRQHLVLYAVNKMVEAFVS
jgi:hypothetical protein